MWNTVLFDFDGTIADTGEGIMKSAQYALRAFGYDVPDYKSLRSFVGPPLLDSFRSNYGVSEETAKAILLKYRERYRPVGLYESALYPGFEKMLADLSAHHFTLVVASSKPTVFVEELLSYFHIRQYFTLALGSELNGERERKSDVIAEAIRRLGMEGQKDEIVYVGDRKYDVEGARMNGLSCIGVLYGYGSYEEMTAVHPYVLAKSVQGVENALLDQAGLRRGALQTSPAEPSGFKPADALPAAPLYESIPMRIWRVVYPALLYFGIASAVSMIGSAIFVIPLMLSGSDAGDITKSLLSYTLPLTGIAAALAIPLMLYFMRRDEARRKVHPSANAFFRKRKWNIGTMLLCVVFLISAANVVDMLITVSGLPDLSDSYQLVEQALESAPLWETILTAVLAGPIAEELIFRGLIFRRLRDYLGPVWAIVISGVFFGIYHGNLVQGVFAAVFGILLALIYERFGTILIPIACHMGNNLFSTLASDGYLDAVYSPVFIIVCAVLALVLGWYLLIFRNPFKKPENARNSG